MDWQNEAQGNISVILHNCIKSDKLKLICDTYQMDALYLLPLFNDNYTQNRGQNV